MPIFPEGALSSSVTTTIWVGVWVLCFFNLRLGWVLSGLVVPGYLAPLILLKPWSAAVVLLEGCLTYFVVWLISERLSEKLPWHNFFGRDRFFALVLISIAIRLSLDGWLLPWLGEWLEARWQIAFDYRNNLHSYGLIIVSLIANQFWKTGFWRGLAPLLVCLALTTLIVRYVLMEFTNFSFGSLAYAYEDLASSILSSPKAYIILIATAFLASRMNLHYGWDFNGILIPSLLALQWYQPLKIGVTLLECGVILGLSHALLQLPLFQRMTMEGARKLLLFFNVSFVYKLALGHALLWLAPAQKITDYYGFGYLLATLMAIKIHDKAIFARLTRATLQTSLLAVGFASLVGFALTLLPKPDAWHHEDDAHQTATLIERPEVSLLDRLMQDRVALYKARGVERFKTPLPKESAALELALEHLSTYLSAKTPAALAEAAAALATLDYRIERLENRYLYLRQDDATPPRGWGIYVLDPQSAGSLLVEVPNALDEPRALDAGFALFTGVGARGLLLSGSARRGAVDQSGDVLHNRQSPFYQAHRHWNRNNALQVHAYTAATTRLLTGERRGAGLEAAATESQLWVKETLPRGLNLGTLKSLVNDQGDHYAIRWDAPPFPNRLREAASEGFAELFLAPEDLRRLLFRPYFQVRAPTLLENNLAIDGYLQEWLLDTKGAIADAGSNAYRPPRLEEMLFCDAEVLTPLLHLVQTAYVDGHWSDAGLAELRMIDRAAALLGYRLIQYRHRITGREYLILAEAEDGARRYWGTYVLRLGPAQDYLLQIPRPLQEVNSFEFAVSLFESLDARALLIAGAHPRANLDGSAEMVSVDNKLSLFNLVNQVLMRESGDAPMLVVQSRAFGYRSDRAPPGSDVLIATDAGVGDAAQASPLQQRLLERLNSAGNTWQWVAGSDSAMGYEVGGVAQAQYLSTTRNKEFALLWLSPLARSVYRQQAENRWQDAQFRSIGISTLAADLYSLLQTQTAWSQAPTDLRAAVADYVRQPDVVRLAQLKTQWPAWRWQRVLDAHSKQAFLLAHDAAGALGLVVNLAPRTSAAVPLDKAHLWDSLARYLESRAAWLVW